MLKYDGEFKMIHKDKLTIDMTYQTGPRAKRKIGKIAEEFCWQSFGAVSVSRRSGVYYVVDGQRRVLASKMRDDVDVVPCVVFRNAGVVGEAESFVNMNVGRAQLNTLDKFKARVVAGDEAAVELDRVITDHGWTVVGGGSPYTIQCVSEIENSFVRYRDSEHGKHSVEAVLDFMAVYYEGVLTKTLFKALFSLDVVLRVQRGETIEKYAGKLKIGAVRDAIDAAKSFSNLTGGGLRGNWLCVQVLCALINKGKKSGRFDLQIMHGSRLDSAIE